MRILFIHNKYQHAGGEDVALELEVSLLLAHGHEVEVLIFDNQQIKTFVKKIGAGIKAFYNLSSARKVSQCIKRFEPHVIHIHNLFFVASPSVLLIAKKYGIPIILTLHNYRLVCANALLLRDNKVCELCVNKTLPFAAVRYKCYRNSAVESALVVGVTGVHKILDTWRKVTRIITLTEFAKSKLLHSSLQPDTSQLKVVPNFVPVVDIGTLPRENFFLYVGRISREKGVNVLIDAFSQMPTQSLLIVGDGPEKKLLEETATPFNNIRFAGKKTNAEVLSLMRDCKTLLFPSLCYEGLPFTILEAFSTGTPVIASRLGAMAELIQEGYNGYLFKPGDAIELKNKISLLLKSDGELQGMYNNARQTYLEKYHPDVHYRNIIQVYEMAIFEKKNLYSG